MTWVTWYNIHSGNRTTRAHIASEFLAGRTECGWLISTLTSPAPRKMPRCQGCLVAIKNKKQQQHFLSKDGKTKYLVSRNFPEDAS